MIPSQHMPAQPDDALLQRMFSRAEALVKQGRYAEALPTLDRLRRAPATSVALLRLRAGVLQKLGRAAEAQLDLSRAIEADPACGALLRERCLARLALDDARGAADDAAAAILADRADVHAKALLGWALLRLRQFDEAIFLLGTALQAEPASPQYQSWLAHAFTASGRYDAAEELLRLREAQQPDAEATELRAANALARGEPEQAVTLTRQALSRHENHPGLHGLLAHALLTLERRDEAARHFALAARLQPDNEHFAHLAAALDGRNTDRAGTGYIAALYDDVADRYESSMLALGCRSPGLLRRALEAHHPALLGGERLAAVIDLGCGTGLMGTALAGLVTSSLVGIDVSRGMLRHAAGKQLYTELRHEDIPDALVRCAAPQDAIVAADALNHFGRLDQVLMLARQRLAPAGLVAFTLGHAAQAAAGWRLEPDGRYAHTTEYVLRALELAGLEPVALRQEELRWAADGPADGLVVVARGTGH